MNRYTRSKSLFSEDEAEEDLDTEVSHEDFNRAGRSHSPDSEEESYLVDEYPEDLGSHRSHRPPKQNLSHRGSHHHDDSSVGSRSPESVRARSGDAAVGHSHKDHNHMTDIYKELQEINDKMKREFKILHERGEMLKEKERALTEGETSLATAKSSLQLTIDLEVRRRVAAKEQEHRAEVERLDQMMKEKTKENKRLKDNFDTLKVANDTLRKELETVQTVHNKLEKQATTLQGRLANLQRKTANDQRRDENDFLPPDLGKVKRHKEPKGNKQNSKACLGTYEILAVLLEWISDAHLRQVITDQPTKPLDTPYSASAVHDKCLKVLPSLVEILKEVASGNTKLVLPCLQFIYWSLLHLDSTQSQPPGVSKLNLSSTLRRLGEELFKPRVVRFAEDEMDEMEVQPSSRSSEKARDKEGMFFRSPSLHIRLLSSLIILRSPLQVDHLAHVFEVLRADLKADQAKQLFLHYQATHMMLPFLRPTNKTLLQAVVDIYLGMAMESPALSGFLEACSSEVWFRAISMVMRIPNMEEKVIEKLSILLQKLSKIKTNKRYFEVFGLTLAVQDLLRAVTNTDNAFLTLNLKSILFNLNLKSAVSTTNAQ